MDLPSGHENRLESDPLLADVAMRTTLRALSDVAYGSEIGPCKPILVALDNDTVGEKLERHVGYDLLSRRLFILIVVGILKELKDEACFAAVEILGQAVTTLAEYLEAINGITYVRTDAPIFLSFASRASSTSRRTSGLIEPIHRRLSSLTNPWLFTIDWMTSRALDLALMVALSAVFGGLEGEVGD